MPSLVHLVDVLCKQKSAWNAKKLEKTTKLTKNAHETNLPLACEFKVKLVSLA